MCFFLFVFTIDVSIHKILNKNNKLTKISINEFVFVHYVPSIVHIRFTYCWYGSSVHHLFKFIWQCSKIWYVLYRITNFYLTPFNYYIWYSGLRWWLYCYFLDIYYSVVSSISGCYRCSIEIFHPFLIFTFFFFYGCNFCLSFSYLSWIVILVLFTFTRFVRVIFCV